MLKHVSVSPWRGRADSVSLSSSGGTSSCGSGSPTPGHTPPPSRASSCASLAPLTALSSFSPSDATSQQVNQRLSKKKKRRKKNWSSILFIRIKSNPIKGRGRRKSRAFKRVESEAGGYKKQ